MSYLENFTDACDPCYFYTLPACPEADDVFTIEGDLDPDTEIHWYLEDKFGKVWTGTATTDADGNVEIPLTDFPAGYFTQNDGYFDIYFKLGDSYSSTLELTFEGTEYDCIRVVFQEIDSDNYVIQ